MKRQQLLMSQLMDLTNELVWLNRPKMEQALDGYKLNEIDLIEKIDLIPEPNVTKLAAATYMTQGEQVNQIHQALHQSFANRDQEVFTNMTEEEFDTIFRFIGRYRQHLKKVVRPANTKSGSKNNN